MSFAFVPKVSLSAGSSGPYFNMATGEMLASAGDDGNVLLWVPSESSTTALTDEHADDKETWRTKHMCRTSSGAEIYDLAWSPDGQYFITGGVDNTARIFNAHTGMKHSFCGRAMADFYFLRCYDTPNSRTHPFRTRGGLGPSQRVCCNSIVGPLCSHLCSQA